MEQEVFGNTELVKPYYQKENVIPFTSSHLYTDSYPFHNVCHIGVIICMFLTSIGLPLWAYVDICFCCTKYLILV